MVLETKRVGVLENRTLLKTPCVLKETFRLEHTINSYLSSRAGLCDVSGGH